MEGRGGLVGKRELHEIVAQLLLNGNRVSQAKTPALILSSLSFESFIHSLELFKIILIDLKISFSQTSRKRIFH